MAGQTKWEYRVIAEEAFRYVNLQNKLNDLGQDGWEAVGVGRGGTRGDHYTTVVLKRQC